jgi:hypothetical protein
MAITRYSGRSLNNAVARACRVTTVLGGLMVLSLGLGGCDVALKEANLNAQSLFWQQMGEFPQGTQAWFQADLQDPVAQKLLNSRKGLPTSTRDVAYILRAMGRYEPKETPICQPLWTSGLYQDKGLSATLAVGQCPAPALSKPMSRWLKHQGFKRMAHHTGGGTQSGLVQSVWHHPRKHLWWVQKGAQTWIVTSQTSLNQLKDAGTPKVANLPWYGPMVAHPAVGAFSVKHKGFSRFALLSGAERSFLPDPLQSVAKRTGLLSQFPLVLASAKGRSLGRQLKHIEGSVIMPRVDLADLPADQNEALVALFESGKQPMTASPQPNDVMSLSLQGGDKWLRYLMAYGPTPMQQQGLAIADQVTRLHGVSLKQDVPQLFAGRSQLVYQLPDKATSWQQSTPLMLLDNAASKTKVLNQLNQLASTLPQKVLVASALTDRAEGGDGWLWQVKLPGKVSATQIALVPSGESIAIGPLSRLNEAANAQANPRGPVSRWLHGDQKVPASAWMSVAMHQPKKVVGLPPALRPFQDLSFWLKWDGSQQSHLGNYEVTLSRLKPQPEPKVNTTVETNTSAEVVIPPTTPDPTAVPSVPSVPPTSPE